MSMCNAGWYQATCHSIQEYVYVKNLVTSVYIREQQDRNINGRVERIIKILYISSYDSRWELSSE